MLDAVTLLESIGADANLMSANGAELEEKLECAGLAPALRAALLEGDVQTLRALLRAPDIVCCLIDAEEDEDEEEEEEGGEDEDGDDEEETGLTRQPKPRGSAS